MPDTIKYDERAKIISNRLVNEAGNIYCLTLDAPRIAAAARPGQMAMIRTGEDDSAMTLRRPFGLAGFGGGVLSVRYAVVGEGTAWLSRRMAGETLDVLGPTGNGYPAAEGKRVLLAGGGTGIFSVLGAAYVLRTSAKALLGFRSAALINSVDAFEACGTAVSVVTDDGSNGRKGFVTDLLAAEIDAGGWDEVWACGPRLMLAAVAKMTGERSVRCFVSMEERMACGIGACMGCVCGIKNGAGTVYKRVCADGPVFDAAEVVW